MALLSKILATQSTSYKYDEMHKLILSVLGDIKGVEVSEDAVGNIFAVKGTLDDGEYYPAFVCHTDTVHDYRVGYKIERVNGKSKSKQKFWVAYYEKDGIKYQTGIGGDDKCGIYACLSLLKMLPKVKCAFYVNEEVGCKGSLASDVGFYDDCRWAVQIDRKGSQDIINRGIGVEMCSSEFTEAASGVGKRYKYRPTEGVYTDVTFLKKEKGLAISCINISAGYYNPHSPSEFIIESDLIRAVQFCRAMANELTDRYPHSPKKKCDNVWCDNPIKDHNDLCSPCLARYANLHMGMCYECGDSLIARGVDGLCEKCDDSYWGGHRVY